MANVKVSGFSQLDATFSRLAYVPFDVVADTLTAMAEEAEQAVRHTGKAMGVYDPDCDVHILDNVTRTKIKKTEGGGVCYVTFKGRHHRSTSAHKNTRKSARKSKRNWDSDPRNAEIAFINEYGKEGQPARPFIRQAAEEYGDQIAARGEIVLGGWMEKIWNEG